MTQYTLDSLNVTTRPEQVSPTTYPSPPKRDSATLQANEICVRFGGRQVLHDARLSLPKGGVTALVGPNGSGKSTLLKACTKLLNPQGGTVLLEGESVARLSTRELAKRLAVLPQGPVAPAHLTVRDLVEQGRYAQVGPLRMLRRQDHVAIAEAIAQVGLSELSDREVDTLSGGERQRAWLALTLAQETPVLALDEPTTFLDIGHQHEILELIHSLNRERGKTILVVLHDLNQAASLADQLVVLEAGRVVATGSPWSVLTPDLLRDVFKVHTSVIREPGHPRPLIVVHGSSRTKATPSSALTL